MAMKKETIATTKDADRLPFVWLTFAKRVKSLGLANLKVESLGDKDFKSLGDEMTKSKKSALWEWTFDFDAFAFEFHLLIGSKSTLLASAKMNVIGDMKRRREILDGLRAGTELVTQSEIDSYFKVVQERAAKSSEVQKIDEEIKKETDSIATDKQFVDGWPSQWKSSTGGNARWTLSPSPRR
jgi:hypothetical protein